MYRTVIFDLDGTLLNSIGDLAAAANYVCRQNGWPEHTEAEIMGMVGHGIPNLVKQFSPKDARSTLMVLNTTAQFNQYYGCHNIELTRPYDGVPALLKRLKAAGMVLGQASDKDTGEAEPQVLRFGEAVRQSLQKRHQRWEEGMNHLERETVDTFLQLPAPQRKLIREVILTFAQVHKAKTE